MVSPLQTERIDIKFKELIGQGFTAKPAYKGGLFEDKYASIDYDNGYRLGHVQSAIYSLSKATINTPQLLLKLIQENLSLKLYRAFLLYTKYNPWTYSKRKLPGYEMLVYLQTCEAGVPYNIEPEEYDFSCVSPSQNKFIREAERINRRKDSKRFLHLLSSRDLQDRLIQNRLFQNAKIR